MIIIVSKKPNGGVGMKINLLVFSQELQRFMKKVGMPKHKARMLSVK